MDESRLLTERNIWLATVRVNGRPHLVPIWFVWVRGLIYICTQEDSVKVRNLSANPRASFSLQDGDKPVVGEGEVRRVEQPFPEDVLAIFKQKYDWDIPRDAGYRAMFEITPVKWLRW
jgi:uncharacterized pyridoxamine 5'-phosphate oxidase family protein